MPPTTPRRRRSFVSPRILRLAATALLGLAVVTCSDDHLNGPSGGTRGYFGFRPVTHLSAPLADFGIVIDSVHIRLTRPPSNTIVLDTTAFFPADSSDLKLALLVSLAQRTDTLDALIELKAGPNVVFRANQSIVIVSGPPGSSPLPVVDLAFVGPGTNIAHITVAPRDTAVALGDSLRYSATAVDSSSNPVTPFYVGWKTSDTTLAKMNATGLLRAPNHRGTLKVIGTTPTGIVDTTTVYFVPVATVLVKVSGDLQSDTAGRTTPIPIVVEAKAADSLGVAGVPVHFSALAGGAVTDSLVLTDSLGHASTPITLGTVAGPQKFLARVGALAPDTFTVTALAGAPSAIAIQAGNAQTDTTDLPLALPLSVKVTDALGNAVTGAKVAWLKVAGGGVVSADTTASDTAGVAAVGYTLGALARTDTISATLAGTSATVTFTATAVAAVAANIVVANGGGQADTVGKTLPQPFVVFVSDARAHLVAGARVIWTATHGGGSFTPDTAFTDSTGHAQTTYTVGTLAGTDSLVGTLPCGGCTATFTVTALAGTPAAIAIQSGNAQSDTAKGTLPLPLVVAITDAHANLVGGAKIIWSVQSGSGTFAGLAVDTVVSGVNGLASVSFTLGDTAGTDSIRATIEGTAASTTFIATSTSGAASVISIVSGSVQSGTVGLPLPAPLIVRVADGSNNAVANAKVFWTRIFGTGTVSADSTVTDALGHAQITFTLGTLVGTDSIKAALASGDSVLFAATGTPGGAATIAATGGNDQSGTTGTALPNPLTVKVTDAHGNAVPGVSITWAVTGGGGTLSGITDTTDATGTSTVSQWTLGGTAGTNTATATLAGATGSPVTFTAVSLPLGTTKTWNGTAGTAWATANSWSPAGIPAITDNVYIPLSAPAPSLTASASVGGLSVETGATLSLGAGDTLTTLGTVLVPAGASVTGAGAIASTGTSQQVSGALANLAVTGSTVLAGPTAVTGAVTISGSGSLTVHGQSLGVGGGVTVAGSGQLVMTNAADSVDVIGAYSAGGATSVGGLTAGVLVVRGNFAQIANSSNDFAASGTHLTRFAGSAPQTVTFANPASVNSHFQGVEFANAAGVTLGSDIVATGAATVTAGTVTGTDRMATILGLTDATSSRWHVDTNTITGSGALTLPDSMSGVVALVGSGGSLGKAFKVNGDLLLTGSGSLALAGHPLTVTGNLALAGSAHLQMANATDSVDVGGAFAAAGASSVGDMTAGTLVLRGAFAQVANSSLDFAPSG
ncbi:MAG: beta strand repeat-containing protein, partial [Gemmatimonadales bacterium]